MLHARNEYNRRVQDSEGIIPDDEPVMLFRGQDKFAVTILNLYADMVELAGGDQCIADVVREHAVRMMEWQAKVKVKSPDMDPEDAYEDDAGVAEDGE